jgi:outer membrane protein OmpA-like peptidoglycan-associated protein
MKAIFVGIALLCSFHVHSQRSLTVYFDFNKYDLTDAARKQLDSFLVAQKENLAVWRIFSLDGYCDSVGSDDYNNILSEKRLLAVKKYLLNYGIEPDHIVSAITHGKKDPLNENKTEKDRQLNRRVEINMKKNLETSLPVPKETIPAPNEIMPAPKEIITLKEKIADTASKAGTNIVLKNINFVTASHRILPESFPALQELLESMKFYPNLVIEIQGHTCCQESAGDGLDADTRKHNLSETRAKSVYDYLISNGIEANRLSYKGYAHTVPIYPFPEKTEEERIANRRVEIKIISK